MLFKSSKDARRAAAIARLVYCNPFLPDRLACEKEALGDEYIPVDPAWHVGGDPPHGRANLVTLHRLAETIADSARQTLAARGGASSPATEEELTAYEEVVLYLLYYRHREVFEQLILAQPRKLSQSNLAQGFGKFVADVEHYFHVPGADLPFPQSRDAPQAEGVVAVLT